ncbi:MAG: hypothetical protein NC541_13425 [bacterium]|nr:hypothetical protein [bacterium]
MSLRGVTAADVALSADALMLEVRAAAVRRQSTIAGCRRPAQTAGE